jgi:hypothetical protein
MLKNNKETHIPNNKGMTLKIKKIQIIKIRRKKEDTKHKNKKEKKFRYCLA